MAALRIIIDGNNLIHHDAELQRLAAREFERARRRLVERIEELVGEIAGDRITVVFDGRAPAMTVELRTSGVEVVFAPASLTADSVIERLAHDVQWTGSTQVVTSDRGERDTVEAQGVTTMSCSNFLELMEQHRRRMTAKVRDLRVAKRGATLGEFFPAAGAPDGSESLS